MNPKLKSIFAICILVLAGFVMIWNFGPENASVQATTRYVGSDSTYKTIQAAVSAAGSGDVIYVKNGTYYESVTINTANIELIGNSTTDCKIIHYYSGTSTSDYAAGINITANNVNVTGFNISVSGNFTFGIYAKNCLNSIIKNHNIATSGNDSYGIFLDSSSNNNVPDNIINTKWDNSYGIYIYQTSDNNDVINNTILTNGGDCHGIYVYLNPKSNNIIDNNITIQGPTAHGIWLSSNANGNNITFNTIHNSNSNSFGISITGSLYNNITYNEINTTASARSGIYLLGTDHTNITGNTINTSGTFGYGIYMGSSSNNDVVDNTINTFKQDGVGMVITQGSYNNNIDDNEITTKGISGYGIYLNSDASYNNVTNNEINTYNWLAYGIFINPNSVKNVLKDNTINTSGDNAHCYYIATKSNETMIINHTLSTKGAFAHGFLIQTTNNTYVDNCTLTTLLNTGFGVSLDGNYAYFVNSTIAANDKDFYITNYGNLTALNSVFNGSKVDVEQDGGGVVMVKNYLAIHTYFEDGMTPLPNADIEVTDNLDFIYRSAGYSGTDPQTDVNGRVENIISTDKWYNYDNTSTDITNTIKVKKSIDFTWEESRTVNMGTSHTEIFISTDIDNPMVPQNLIIESFPNSDWIKLDWDANSDDTIRYEIFIIDPVNGKWRYHRNITHPSSQYYETNEGLLLNGTTFYFKVRAWDDAGHHSDFTEVVSVFHIDNRSPVAPTELVAEAVSETEIQLTWVSSNSRDLVAAGIYINNPTNSSGGPYHKIGKVPMPLYTTTVTGLEEHVTYYFVVTGIDKANLTSPFSNEANATTLNIPPPDPAIYPIPSLTNTPKINLTGMGEFNATINIYNNGVFAGSGVANSTDEFMIEVMLVEGLNEFKAIAVDRANNTSNFSNSVSITLDTIPPDLTLSKFIAYTNNPQFVVSGTTENDLKVLIYNNDNLAYTGYANAAGIFMMKITLENGTNSINAHAIDTAGNFGNNSTAQIVILDLEPPSASAGPDVDILRGNSTTFDGSSSTDNWGIDNYTWTFDYQSNSIALYGQVVSFQFNATGIYEVTLTVEDLAGNTDTDMLWVVVPAEDDIDLEPPVAVAGGNHEIATGTTINFDGSGSSDNIGISNFTWSFVYGNATIELFGDKVSFKFDLAGNYTLTLTVFDYRIPANSDSDTLWVNVIAKSDLDTDEDGIDDQWEDDNGLDKYDPTDAGNDNDNDGLNNTQEYQYETDPQDTDTDADGLPDGWEVANGLDPLDDGTLNIDDGATGDPDGDGHDNLEEFERGTDPQDSESKPKKAEEEELFDETMLYIILMIIVIIILIAFLAVALRKPGPTGDELLAAEEEEEFEPGEADKGAAKMEPTLDVDTFECPTCGANLTDEDNVCPECGETFDDEE